MSKCRECGAEDYRDWLQIESWAFGEVVHGRMTPQKYFFETGRRYPWTCRLLYWWRYGRKGQG